MTKKNEVAKTKKGEVALNYDYGDHAGVGLDLTMDDLKIPFIYLMQKDSKVLDTDEDNYVEGGAEGMLFNAATKTFHDELILVPAVKRTTYVEWLPDRGGFAGEHMSTDDVVRAAKANAAKRNELRHPDNSNELQETRSLFCIVLDPKDMETPIGFCVVPFTSSKLTPWRDYFTSIDTAKVTKGAPLYAHSFRLSSVPAVGKGKKFKNYRLTPLRDKDGKVTDDPSKANIIGSLLNPASDAFLRAVDLRDAIESGRAEADRDTQVAEESGDQVF